jgi:ATP-binding cassette subfamily B protein
MGMGMGAMRGAHRNMTRDREVLKHDLTPGIWRRIYEFASPYRSILSVFLLLIVLDAIIGVANPLIIREIVDYGIDKRNSGVIVHFALLIAILAVADTSLNVFQRMISARVGEGLIYDMRSRVFAHVSKMPIAFFTRTQTGALVSRLNNDVMGAQQAFTDVLQNVVSNFVTVILVVTAMLFLSWPITLAAIALLPIFVFPARRVGRKLQIITRESYNLNAELTTLMTERFNVSGALLVKIFGRPAVERENFDRRAGRVRDIGITQAMYARIFFSALSLTATLATALVYGWGGILAVHHELNIGTIIALTIFLARLYGPLTALSNVQLDVMTALVSFDRVFEILDLPPMIGEIANPKSIPRGIASVEFRHVSFSYPASDEVSLASLESVAIQESHRRVEVLHDLCFVVEPGQMVALVGHSGAGKTTVSHLVSRIYDVSDGAVLINGIDVREASFDSLQGAVGIVTQDAHLFHDTIRENLLFAKPDASEEGMREALGRAQIDGLIESLPDGLDTLVGDRGYRLSGGEKQRLAIARLLLKAPDVVVLDEATAHLDSESEAAVQVALDTALTDRTSIVIAHRLSTIRNADQILVLEQGRIVQRGHHAELIEQGGLYAELYRTQFAEPEEPPSVSIIDE